MTNPRIALLSAYDKTGLVEFAEDLVQRDWKLLASAGTAKHLQEHGVPVKDIGEPIMRHRVVTVDRKIYAAILARLDVPNDMEELRNLRVQPITLVYVDLYPLAQEMARKDRSIDRIIENIDVGGPALLRAAAKAGRCVVADKSRFPEVIAFLDESSGEIRRGIRNEFLATLAAEAEKKCSGYSELVGKFYSDVAAGSFRRRA